MTSYNHMYYHSCNGSQEPFFSKTMLAFTRKRYHKTVTTLPWPARSPDLSPIEHIWDNFGRRVEHPTSVNEPGARLQQIWNEMSQDIIQNMYASMPDRITSLHSRWRGFNRVLNPPFCCLFL
ncbi:transposable element Tcb1 transposase [Trichonephila clavipes]|nr:transposable element Tcb1 transposase [Trichonephila clavipes]